MTDRNQAYAKICAECKTNAIKLFVTEVKESRENKRVYRMLCESCAALLAKHPRR